MKKNKNIQYVLVAMVVAIWGAVVFQFFNFKQDAPVSYEIDSSLPFRSMTDSSELETYALQVDYKDPFWGGSIVVLQRAT
ncbi:MAG: hypothetical protein ACI9RM_002978 [Ulvibacter sp.]|jgi:hypothetical protein